MNAAGMSPWLLFRAFMTVAIVVSLFVMAISAYFAPKGLRMLRDWLTEVRANVVSSMVQPGHFTSIENSVTIHIRERRPNGQLAGILLDDRRNRDERITIMAEVGELIDNDKGTFLILQERRRAAPCRRSARSGHGDVRPQRIRSVAVRQRPASGEIFDPRALSLAVARAHPRDPFYIEEPGQFRAELHDRLMAPFYPLAFVVIAFAYLGAPRTTRQSRTVSMFGAIGGVALSAAHAGLASSVCSATLPMAPNIARCGSGGWCAARRDRQRRSPRRRAGRTAPSADRAVRRGTGPAVRRKRDPSGRAAAAARDSARGPNISPPAGRWRIATGQA